MATSPSCDVATTKHTSLNRQEAEEHLDQLNKESAAKDSEIAQLKRQKDQLDQQLRWVFKEREELSNQKDQEKSLSECESKELADHLQQLSAVNEATVTELNNLQRDIDELRLTIAKNESQLVYRQRAVDVLTAQTLHYESRIDEMNLRQSRMEDICRAVHKKVRDSEKVIKVSIDDMQITDIKLGKGEYGAVSIATWENSTVAVKVFSSEAIRESYLGQTFQSEIVLCSKLLHPNVATVYGFYRVKYGSLMAIMELLQGSLNDVMEVGLSAGQYLTLREQLDVTRDCMRGLLYLHNLPQRVIHCDIRPTNILLTPTMTAKLADLGEARLTDTVLVHVYSSPERNENRPLTPATDVFSMGLTMTELFSGKKPVYSIASRKEVLQAVPRSDLHDICTQMTYWTLTERISIAEAIRGVEYVIDTPDYWNCPPRRMVKGKLDGADGVTLLERPGSQ